MQDKTLDLFYISSYDQLADLFTKSMASTRHAYLVSKLILADFPHEFEGGCKHNKPISRQSISPSNRIS